MSEFTNLESIKILDTKEKVRKAVEELDMTLRKLQMRPQYFVTGGCIGSLLRNEVPNDYDVYFLTEGAVNLISNLYKHDESYKNEVEVYDEKYREYNGVDGRLITENAITLKNKIQLITKHYGSPDAVRKTFDFVHCMPYFDPVTDKLYISRQQYDLCVNKKLLVNNIDNVTPHRKNKFFERGWTWL
jgi:hypothetical protein